MSIDMRHRTWLIVGAAFALALQTVAAAGPELHVSGRVLGPGGRPLEGAQAGLLPALDPVALARLSMSGSPPLSVASVRTGASGTFMLKAPKQGLWSLRVEAAGFVPMERKPEPLLETTELDDLELRPDLGFALKITGAEGRPVADALVRMSNPDGNPRGMSPASSWRIAPREGRSGSDGTLRLPRVSGDNAALSVSAPGYEILERAGLDGSQLSLSLIPAGARAMHVANADRKAAAGVLVTAGKYDHPLGFTDPAGRLNVFRSSRRALPLRLAASDGRRAVVRLEAASVEDEPPANFTLPDTVNVSGQVLDFLTRRPLAGALVWATEARWNVTRSGPDGGYTLGAPPGRSLQLVAAAAGYVRSDSLRHKPGGIGVPGPVLVLHPAAALEGEVLVESGRPVTGATVRLDILREGRDRFNFYANRGALPQSSTDARGHFRLGALDAEHSYLLQVSAPRYATAEQAIRNLEPRKTRSGLRIVLSPGRTVTGTVLDPDGKPLADAEASLLPTPSDLRFIAQELRVAQDGGDLKEATDASGRFAITHVPAGTFDLEIHLHGFATNRSDAYVIEEGAEPLDLGGFTLEKGERIRGVVRDGAGQPITAVEIWVRSGGGSILVGPAAENRKPDALTAQDGWFEVGDLRRGSRADMTFMRTGYVTQKEPGVEVPRLEPLAIALQASSRVSGRVTDSGGEPVGGAQVKLTRLGQGGGGGSMFTYLNTHDTTTDDGGNFLFEYEEPGKVKLSAVASGFQETKIEGIEIPKGQDVEGLKLALAPGAAVSGRVLDEEDRPCIGASVRAVTRSAVPFMPTDATAAVTDGAGIYRLEGLAPGPASFEATYEDHGRAVRDLEIKPGTNTLDFRFEGGRTISGQVIDSSGSPVANASVTLLTTNESWTGSSTESTPDGAFQLKGIRDGEYLIRAAAKGYAPYRGETPIKVAGEPVVGVQVRLDPSAAISGRVIGLPPADYPLVRIRAEGPGASWEPVGVDHGGRYRVGDLGEGEYRVVATLSGTGRQTAGKVEIAKGTTEAGLDLEFGQGVVLSGKVFLGDAPLKGATIFVQAKTGSMAGGGSSDGNGAFRIEGLQAGNYDLIFRQWDLGVVHSEPVDLEGSRDIEVRVPTARVAGLVLDAGNRQPLPAVQVSLKQAGPHLNSVFQAHMGVTDQNGRFEMGNVSNGSWTAALTKEGYAAASLEVSVENGTDRDNLRIEMSRTEGLTLIVRLPAGGFPDSVRAAVLDAAGHVVSQGNFPTRENGEVRLSSVPAGSWDIVIAAAGAATAIIQATAPGPPLSVALPPPCSLEVQVPDLKGSALSATLTIADDRGRPFRTLSWSAQPSEEWSIDADGSEFRTLPPGTWTVRAAAPDGRAWQGSVTTSPGKPATVNLK